MSENFSLKQPKDQSCSAFPMPASDGNYAEYGMTLRQWYKGQAIIGLLADKSSPPMDSDLEWIAEIVGLIADAQLAEDKS